MSPSERRWLRDIEAKVGPLPASYVTFLTGPEALRRTWKFTDHDDEPAEIVFFELERVADRIAIAPVEAADGLLVIGVMNGEDYVLDVRSGAVWRWTLEHPWPAGRDTLLRVDDHFGSFVKRLWYVPRDTRDDDLQALAEAGDAAAIEAFLAARPVDDRRIEGGGTLAERAAREGRTEVVRRCLERGCEARRLVAFAVRGGHIDTLRFLLEERGLEMGGAWKDGVLSTPEMRAWLATWRRERGYRGDEPR